MTWVIVSLMVVFFNIPFGYWREYVTKLSLQWFLSVHIPVLLIVLLRSWLDLGWAWTTYPILIGSYFSGQYLGAIWHRIWKKSIRVTGCLFYDIARSRWIIIIFGK
ncbi:hypothetical protein E4K67_21125 [Desulfosporosinus fructosivorans]|uniref:Uncharacterized protein n=1 Tax=Desulfosporosinus fructosivorans TaxID=2018669 RepID=A0A4Z0R1N6_9FIRM|nr:hypothetical protein E4K67_21125 [Desulfosporosinus fructosivorans]